MCLTRCSAPPLPPLALTITDLTWRVAYTDTPGYCISTNQISEKVNLLEVHFLCHPWEKKEAERSGGHWSTFKFTYSSRAGVKGEGEGKARLSRGVGLPTVHLM